MKQKIIIGVTATILLSVGIWLVRQATFGSLSVATNNPNATITLATGMGTDKVKNIGKGGSNIKLSPGSYTVQATNGEKVTRGAVTIMRGEETSINLLVADTRKQETVARYTARDLFFDGTSLNFLNVPQKLPYTYSYTSKAASMLSEVYPSVEIIHWYNAKSALLQTSDEKYHYLNNGVDSVINLSGNVDLPAVDSISVNDAGNLAYLVNNTIYYRETIQSSAITLVEDITKLTASTPNIVLSNTGLVLIEFSPDGSGDGEDEKTTPTTDTPNARTVDVQSKKITSLNLPLYSSHWSPDGKRFVATTSKGLELFSKNGTPVGFISSLGNSGSDTATWVNNKKFVYMDGSTIWEYTLGNNISQKLGSISGSIARSQPFAVSTDGQYVVYATDPKPAPGAVGSIYKMPVR